MRFILHINLKTGSQLPVYREQVDQGLIEKAGLLLPLAITNRIPLDIYDYDICIWRTGRCARATIWISGTPHITCQITIAGHSKCGSMMWRNIADYKCPAEPWLAYRWHVEPIPQLNDFIHALSWAWIDSLKKR